LFCFQNKEEKEEKEEKKKRKEKVSSTQTSIDRGNTTLLSTVAIRQRNKKRKVEWICRRRGRDYRMYH